MTDNPKQFEILNKTLCHEGFFRLYRYQLKHTLFAGGWSAPVLREVLERGQAVAVLPYDPVRDEVVMIEQFRPGAMYSPQGAWLWEIVAGIIEPNEAPKQVAQREMLEEAGCEILALQQIYHCFASPGGATETTTLFCGKIDSSQAGGVHGLAAEHEDIQVHVLDFSTALAKLNAGKIYYAPAIMALQWLALNRHWLRAAWQAGDSLPALDYTSSLHLLTTQLPDVDAAHCQWLSIETLQQRYHPPFEIERSVLIANLQQAEDLQVVQQVLRNAYPKDFELYCLPNTQQMTAWQCRVADLAQQTMPDMGLVLYLPPDTHADSFSSLQNTIAHLRAPEGCPWDRKQTLQSLRPYLLEEVHEVLEAIDANDLPALAEELGDLLLQIVLQTQVAIDMQAFQMRDVLTHINQKMLRRHPHVFSNVVVADADAVVSNWEAIKQAEKAAAGHTQSTSVLSELPKSLPALAQALAISEKVVRVGFEWEDIDGVLDKIAEEAREVAGAANSMELEAEIGDLLFSVVQLARWKKVDPESALRSMCARFTRRFQCMEQLVAADHQQFSQLSSAALEAYWQQAKQLEKNA